MSSKILIGGQAVIEGVMLRNKDFLAVAVRKPSSEIVVYKEKINILTSKKIFSFIFIRGIVALIQALVLGMKTLIYSAEVLEENPKKTNNFTIFGLISTSLIFGIAIFVFLPLGITSFFANKVSISQINFNIIDGVIRLLFFLIYLLIISQMKDIKRVFQYHGAEHKVVNTYESEEICSEENVKKYSTIHPRCGTTFLLIVILISIFVFSLLLKDIPFYLKFVYRLFLLPFIAAVSYEIIRLSTKKMNSPFCKILLLPGLWLQKLTTSEPDSKQIEVALAALKKLVNGN